MGLLGLSRDQTVTHGGAQGPFMGYSPLSPSSDIGLYADRLLSWSSELKQSSFVVLKSCIYLFLYKITALYTG